ncbi:MAG: glycosyl transferase, partial [Cyanobacteria bacterium J06636_28]
MKTLLFYCRHILGIGHLMRSVAIVHGLMQDFQVYFVNGGESIQEFPIPQGINVIHLPAVKTAVDIDKPQVGEPYLETGTTVEHRRDLLLELCDRIHPDAVMLESFPFDHHQFAAELIPLLEWAKTHGARTICSLRDIVVTSQGRAKYEARVCHLINQYFDQLLIHSDPRLISLEHSFSLVEALTCDIHYTGYIVPDIDREFPPKKNIDPPMILVSVGGGRFGHGLLDCVAKASQYLEDKIPHHVHMFTGPFVPMGIYDSLQKMAACCSNLTVKRYTPDLLSYMVKADLSISIASYDTTLNVLQTGVRA